jgi:uncharacterized protein (TIGR02145 family)
MLASVVGASGQVIEPFHPRTSQYSPDKTTYTIKGDFTVLGNTNLILQPYTNDYGNNNSGQVGNVIRPMRYVDIDGDASTVNSSSAQLSFPEENGCNPACTEVVYAGLYWMSRGEPVLYGNNIMVNNQVVDGKFRVTQSLNTDNKTNTYTITRISNNTVERQIRVRTDNHQVQTRNGNSGSWTTQNGANTSSTPSSNTINHANYQIRIGSGDANLYNDNRWWPGHDGSHNNAAFRFSADGVTYYIYGISRYYGLYITKGTGTEYTVNGHTMYQNKIKFKHQSESAYTTVTATTSEIMYPTADTSWNGNYFINIGYAEVTDYVRAHGEGNYFGADIALCEGPDFQVGYCGGWALVVVYQNEDMKWRNITLFDGYALTNGDNHPLINIEGFEANPAGDVAVKVAMMTAEGDRGMPGDRCRMLRAGQTQITNNANTYFELSHPQNTPTNFFNGSIYTGGNARNPNYLNNCGMDISMVTLDNSNKQYIRNGQTKTQFRFSCVATDEGVADIYVPWFFGISIQCYVPEPEAFNAFVEVEGAHFDETENAYVVRPGDSISFLIDIRNRGTESVRDAVIQVPIPRTANLSKPHSFEFMAPERSGSIEFDATAGANGMAIWHLDKIPAGYPDSVYATLRLDFVLTEDCYELMSSNEECKLELLVDGTLTAIGVLSNVPVNASTFVVGYQGGGQCKGELVRHPIRVLLDRQAYLDEGHCDGDYSLKTLQLCTEPAKPNTINFMEVYNNFPAGTRFFNSYPITETTVEYTVSTGFPLPSSGKLNVIAITNAHNAACYTNVKLQKSTELEDAPTVTPGESTIHYCVNETALPLSTHVTADSGYTLYFYRTINGAAETDIVPSTEEPGTYTYYVRQGTENCISDPVTITVIVHSPATLSSSLSGDETCAGNQFTVTATGASGTYTWNSEYNGFATQSGKVLTISSGAPAGTLTATYTVTASSEYCASGATVSKTITIYPATVAGHIEPPTTQLCRNGSFEDLVLKDYVGEVVKWEYRTGTSGTWTTVYNTTERLSADMINTITTTTYFRATVKNGNCSEVITPTVSVVPSTSTAPNAPTMPSPQFACPNTSYTIAIGSNNASRLKWYATASAGSSDPSLRTVQMGTSYVTRYVSAVDASGVCESKRTLVSVRPKFNAGSIIGGKKVSCIDGTAPTIQNSVSAESFDGGTITYSWTVTPAGGTESPITGAADASYSVPSSYMDHEGSYVFKRYAQVTGCPEDPSVGEYKLTVVDCDAEYTEEMCPLKDDYPYAPFDTTFKTGTVSGDYIHHGSKVVDGVTIDTTALLHLTIWDEYEKKDTVDVCLYEETYTQTYSKNEYVTITTTTSGVTVTSSSSTVVIDATDAVNGNFLLKMKTIHGCDSIISLHVDYDIVRRDTVYKDTLYAGTPYTTVFSNKTFNVTEAGTYTIKDTVTGSNGCDSITTRVLIVEPLHKDTICQSAFATYKWRGNSLSASTDSHGYYEFPGQKTIDGTVVDTISYLLLTINPNPVVEVTSLSDLCPNVGFGALTATITTATVANYTFVWKGDLNTIPTTTTTPYLTNETAVAIPAPPASCGKTYYDTVTVTDANGCSAMARATVSVKTPATPTIAAKTGIHDDDLGCNPSTFVLTYENFTVTDECNGAAQAVVTPSTVVESGCGRTQTWTANYTNACGASASPVVITYTWTVDLTAPTILLKTGSEANGHNWGCNPTVVPPAFTVSDNCAGNIDLPADSVNVGSVINTSTCGRSRTWTAHYTDPCKNKATNLSITYYWTVDETVPTISLKTGSKDDGYDWGCNPTVVAPVFTVADNCAGNFDLPADSVTAGAVTNTSTCGRSQTWTAHYTDPCGNKATNVSITYNWTEDLTVPTISLKTGSKADGYNWGCNPTVVAPAFTVSDNCAGSSIDLPADSVTVTGPTHSGCAYTQTWTAHYTDPCKNKATNLSITYYWTEDVTVPTISLKTGSKADGYNWGCNPTVVPPAFTVSDNCAGDIDLPADSVTAGAVTNTSTCGRSRTWTARYTDPCKNKAENVSITYYWTEDETVPTISLKTGYEADGYDWGCNPTVVPPAFTVSDNCAGDIDLPADSVTVGAVNNTSTCGRSQTWTAHYTDPCKNKAENVSITYYWTEDKTKPVISVVTNSNPDGACNPTITAPTFKVNDNCAGEFALPTDSIIDGGVVNTSVCGRSQTWTAHYTDPCGNKATDVSVTYTWTEDNTAPILHTEAVSDHKGCNPTIVAPTFTVTDNCEGTFVLNADSVTTTGKTGSGCEKTQSWTAHYTDGCGNKADPQTVTYSWKEDTQKPVINTTATDSYLGCDPTTITPPTFSVSDNCEGNFALPTDSVTDGGVVAVTGEPHKFSRTWTAHFTDLCGNKADNVSITYTWVEAPTVTISCPPDVNKTLAYGDCVMNIYPAEIGTPTVNAPADWPMTVSNDIPADDLYQEGETIITWVATDGICGYSVSCQQKVIVVFPQCPDAVDCEGNVYHGVRIDCDCWTQTNLQSNYYGDPGACEEEIPCKYTYDANAAAEYGIDILNDNFGRLYCPEAGLKDSADNGHGHIRGICPKGWYLPTPEKYEALNLHGADALKSPLYWTDGGGNNSTEFTWLPAGWWNGAQLRFEGLTSEGYFLSTKIVAGEISTHVHVIVHDCDVVKEIEVNSGYGYSVRCIKEKD